MTLVWSGYGQANTPDCEALARIVAKQSSIPEALLPAIARMESGYSHNGGARRAWPWTINQAGNSMYFDTRAEALAYLEKAVADGVTNIDVGCMQINYHWHHEAFPSLSYMLDPLTNIRYSAVFMKELYNRVGNWEQATAYYHSTDAKRGPGYQTRVAEIQTEILAQSPPMQQRVSMPIMEPGSSILQNTSMPLVDLVFVDSVSQTAQVAVTDGLDLEVSINAELMAREKAPARLQHDWDKVQFFRDYLALQP